MFGLQALRSWWRVERQRERVYVTANKKPSPYRSSGEVTVTMERSMEEDLSENRQQLIKQRHTAAIRYFCICLWLFVTPVALYFLRNFLISSSKTGEDIHGLVLLFAGLTAVLAYCLYYPLKEHVSIGRTTAHIWGNSLTWEQEISKAEKKEVSDILCW